MLGTNQVRTAKSDFNMPISVRFLLVQLARASELCALQSSLSNQVSVSSGFCGGSSIAYFVCGE